MTNKTKKKKKKIESVVSFVPRNAQQVAKMVPFYPISGNNNKLKNNTNKPKEVLAEGI